MDQTKTPYGNKAFLLRLHAGKQRRAELEARIRKSDRFDPVTRSDNKLNILRPVKREERIAYERITNSDGEIILSYRERNDDGPDFATAKKCSVATTPKNVIVSTPREGTGRKSRESSGRVVCSPPTPLKRQTRAAGSKKSCLRSKIATKS